MTRSRMAAVRWLIVALACAVWSACGDDDDDTQAERDAGKDASTANGGGRDAGDGSGGNRDAGGGGTGGDAGADGKDAAVSDAATPPACGDDAGQDVDDASAVRDDLYPMVEGSRWVYRHSGATPWDEHVKLAATEYAGKDAYLLTDSAGPSGTHGKTILARKGEQVLRIHRDEYEGDTLDTSTDYDPGFVRFSAAWADAKVGFVETLGYARVERDADGVVTADGMRSHKYTVQSKSASVSVPAGEFEDCLQVLRSRMRKPGASAVEGDEDVFWFCPGIGKVREEDQVTGETEELVSCDVPGGACDYACPAKRGVER